MEPITLTITSPPVRSSSNSKTTSQAGFSLLELAIVLIILGILGGLSLPLLTAHISRAALQKTRAHQDYALQGIAAFVEKNNRLPCPADPQATGPTYGLQRIHCRGEKAKGILPFKTLGISETYAKDGFKRLMTYVVDPELTKRDTDLHNERGGAITVNREDGISVLAPQKDEPNPNFVALILISHGESGGGAYIGNGQSGKVISDSSSPHKRENSDDNFTFVEGGQTDDILRWESRDMFLKYYVKLR